MRKEEDLQLYFDFLAELRLSGKTNMFGAGPYLKMAFPELTSREAYDILGEWMDSFKKKPGREKNGI